MSSITKIRKLAHKPAQKSGVSTTLPFLTADDNAGLRVGVAEFAPGTVDMELTFNEGVFVLSGEIEIDSDGETHVASAGEFLWMPEGRAITYRARTPTRFLYVIPGAG